MARIPGNGLSLLTKLIGSGNSNLDQAVGGSAKVAEKDYIILDSNRVFMPSGASLTALRAIGRGFDIKPRIAAGFDVYAVFGGNFSVTAPATSNVFQVMQLVKDDHGPSGGSATPIPGLVHTITSSTRVDLLTLPVLLNPHWVSVGVAAGMQFMEIDVYASTNNTPAVSAWGLFVEMACVPQGAPPPPEFGFVGVSE